MLMERRFSALAIALALSACASPKVQDAALAPVSVSVIAFNDFHGNLQPVEQPAPVGQTADASVAPTLGGAAYLASAVTTLKSRNPNHVVVSAGDLIGASPIESAVFLDEPTIAAMNRIGVDFNAVGNHEFDKGRAELLRMQNGGCAAHTSRKPCAIEPFHGADFRFLAANVVTESGNTLFPSFGIKTFGAGARQVKVGFIGMTLEGTPALVAPAGVAGLDFRDEADTANALVARLRSDGADAIVLLIHEGVRPIPEYQAPGCDGLSGDLFPILSRLDPSIDVVVSGHTHFAYICDYGTIDPARPFLLTSAGKYGAMVTDIELRIDPAHRRRVAKRAENIHIRSASAAGAPGQGEFQPDPQVAALVARYVEAAAPVANRVVGRLSAPALRERVRSGETVLGDLIADAQLAATRAPEAGGAQIAFMNKGGLRTDLVPAADGSITYGQLFAAQPFGNGLVVKSLTGRQIRAVLEQQFDSGTNSIEAPDVLSVSDGFHYGYDRTRPAGRRVVQPTLNGVPLQDEVLYRVTVSNFLASGGDGFTIFGEGVQPFEGGIDVDALERYIAAQSTLALPAADRVVDQTP